MKQKEVKTLKDLKCMGETHGFRPRWINEDELKAEAIKWVKFYQTTNDEAEQWIRRWICKFFNLTVEDLK